MTNGWGLGPEFRATLFLLLVSGASQAVAASSSASCNAPAAEIGGIVNAHTRYLEQNLLPAVIEAGDKPLSLADRMQA